MALSSVPGSIPIYPDIGQDRTCPHCGASLSGGSIVWHGMHILIADRCDKCSTDARTDLRVGHASVLNEPLQIDLTRKEVHCDADPIVKRWLGEPLLRSLLAPSATEITLEQKRYFEADRVVILNCIDHLYGHVLLKLLNAQKHIDDPRGCGLIVIVPRFMSWMVPEGVAETWTVDIPLRAGQEFYPSLDRQIREECKRFREVFVSIAHSHPTEFDIVRFTGVPAHDFSRPDTRVTFIWREDRVWDNSLVGRALKRMNAPEAGIRIQNRNIVAFFDSLRSRIRNGTFTVAGLGTKTSFPDWIDDRRVAKFDVDGEREACRIYSESRLVIGIHGSNMLLPSAHAGMTIDLMPTDRWGNFAQDILYSNVGESDPRLLAFRYRYPPHDISFRSLTRMASNMLEHFEVVASTYGTSHHLAYSPSQTAKGLSQ